MDESTEHPPGHQNGHSPPVVPIELFFDLVFVFVLSQITHAIQDDLSLDGLFRSLVYFLLLWSVWVGFAWVGNAHRAGNLDDGGIPRRLIIIAAMALLIALGLVVPEAATGLAVPAAILYAADYLLTAREDRALRRAVTRMLALQALVPATALVVALWLPSSWGLLAILVALAIGYAAPWITREQDWQFSAEHADERFSLLMLIVLGESLLSIGFGAALEPFGWLTVATIALGVLIVASLWWQYFDIVAHQGAAFLDRLDASHRISMSRIIYSYLHVLLVIAVMLMAVGLHAASEAPREPLPVPQSVMLPAGIALYLATLAVIRLIMRGRILWPLPIAAALTLLVIPLAGVLPALASEILCVLILLVLVIARETYKRRGVIQPIH